MKLRNFLSDNFSVGKGAIKLPIESLLEDYREGYKKLEKKPKVAVFKMTSTGSTVAHVEIPSQTIEGFHYDVILELNIDNAKDYEDCHIKVFSNSPSFVYSYAYVFYHYEDTELGVKGMIIDKYHQKIPKANLMPKVANASVPEEVLTHKPVMRNPLGIPLFDKTTYYAVFALMEQIPFRTFKNNLKLIADRALFLKIEDFETIMAKRKRLAAKQKFETKEAKVKKLNDIKRDTLNREKDDRERRAKDSKVINVVKPMSTTSGVRKISQSTSGGVRKANKIK